MKRYLYRDCYHHKQDGSCWDGCAWRTLIKETLWILHDIFAIIRVGTRWVWCPYDRKHPEKGGYWSNRWKNIRSVWCVHYQSGWCCR